MFKLAPNAPLLKLFAVAVFLAFLLAASVAHACSPATPIVELYCPDFIPSEYGWWSGDSLAEACPQMGQNVDAVAEQINERHYYFLSSTIYVHPTSMEPSKQLSSFSECYFVSTIEVGEWTVSGLQPESHCRYVSYYCGGGYRAVASQKIRSEVEQGVLQNGFFLLLSLIGGGLTGQEVAVRKARRKSESESDNALKAKYSNFSIPKVGKWLIAIVVLLVMIACATFPFLALYIQPLMVETMNPTVNRFIVQAGVGSFFIAYPVTYLWRRSRL